MAQRGGGLRRALTVVGLSCAIARFGEAQASPGLRYGASMVYDGARKEMLLFGGLASDSSGGNLTYPRDLWAWDGSTWRRRTPADGIAPPGREVPTMGYDRSRQRVVLLGGRRGGPGQTQLLRDLWEWDGERWREARTSNEALLHASAAYDPVRRRLAVFGGVYDAGVSRRLLEWDGAAWSVRDSSGPPTGSNPTLAVAAATTPTGALVLVTMQSGNSADSVATLTWSLDGDTWTRRELGPAITSLQPAGVAPDGTIYIYQSPGPWLRRAIMHVRAPDGGWRSLSLDVQPPARFGAAAAYDPDRKRFVLYGGGEGPGRAMLGDTWEFDGATWQRVAR